MDGDRSNPQVPFDDVSADWRSLHVHVKVLEVFAGDVAVGDELVLGLAFGPQTRAADVCDGFLSYGQAVAFTTDDEFVVPYDDSLVPVAWDGAFLSPVDEGRLPFPALAQGEHEGHGGEVLSKFDTLAEIRALSSAAAR